MNFPVVLRPEARAEYHEAAAFYEEQRAGLGAEFTEEIGAVLDRIAAMPELNRVLLRDIRRATVRRFAYHVFYRVEADQVVVFAVVHKKRDPSVWQSRH